MGIVFFTLFLLVARLGHAASQFDNSSSTPLSLTVPPSTIATTSTLTPSPKAKELDSCDACTIHGGEVQVYWWPTANDGQQIKTTNVDAANNFTFYSPSIYVVFSTLFTENACSTGASLPITTIAFVQDALSTATGWRWNTEEYTTRPPRLDTAFILATWGNKVLETCTYTTTSFYQPLDGPYQNNSYPDTTVLTPSLGTSFTFDWGQYTVSHNPCSPTLSAPPQIFTIEPGWGNCVRSMDGFFDPPSALQEATFITPNTTPAPNPPAAATTTNVATQGPSPAPVTPSPTPQPIPESTLVPVQDTSPTQPATPEDIGTPSNIPTADNPSPTLTPTPNDPGTQPEPVDSITPIPDIPGIQPDPVTSPGTTTPFVVIGSQTVLPGQPPITVSGTPISLQPDGSRIIVGTNTLPVAIIATPLPTLVVGTQTLVPGGSAITVSDSSGKSSVLSLQPGGSSVVIGDSAIPIAQVADLKVVPATPLFVLAGQTFTPAGNAVTITDASGKATMISLQPGASSVVFGDQTIPVVQFEAAKTSAPDGVGATPQPKLASLIVSIGGYGSKSQSAGDPLSTGLVNGAGENGTVLFTGAATPVLRISMSFRQLILGLGGIMVIMFCQ